jgi:putative ABC transport system ATP-binding protein
MITTNDVTKTFIGGTKPVTAVKKVSMSVQTGSFSAIIGKSGSGKSTLLALLGALDSPTSGSIQFDTQEVSKLHGSSLLKFRRSTVGFIFQQYNLIPNLTALENVMLPLEFSGMNPKQQRTRAMHLLKEVGLSAGQEHRRPGKLSGGEQQRVAIARALANKPKLVLADEPTGNLDSHTSAAIISLLKSLTRSEETTIIIVTHDQAIADQADHVYQISDGVLTTK